MKKNVLAQPVPADSSARECGTQTLPERTILDSSGLGNNGTPSGSPTYRSDVPVNVIPLTGAPNLLSLEFDGLSQISFSNLFQFHISGDATLEFWLKFSSVGHESVFWTRPDGLDQNRYNIFTNYRSTYTFNFDPRVATPGLFHPVPITPNVWTHLAVVRVGDTNYSIYKDGIWLETVTDNTPLPTAVGWTISGRPANRYHGFIDEVRISGTALSPSQFLNAQVPEPGVPEPGSASLVMIGAVLVILGWRVRR